MAEPLNLLEQKKKYPNKGDKIVSYTQFEKWVSCPRKWYLSYPLKKSVFKQNIHTTFGKAMHTIIQEYLKKCFTDSVKNSNSMPLEDMFLDEFIKEYKKGVGNNGGEHFTDKQEFMVFYKQGIEIINNFKNNRSLYLSTRDMVLVGIETETLDPVLETSDKVKLRVFIDLIFYDKVSDEYLLIDLKTSTRGWSKYQKNDEIKRSQLLIYKKEFSEKFNIPEEKIKVKFLILRREVESEDLEFPLKRIQEYDPPQSTRTTNKVYKLFKSFVEECYTSEGNYNMDGDYPAIMGAYKSNCRFCEFKDNENLCPKENRRFE